LSRMALRRETPLIQIVDKPILPLEKKKPGRLLTGITYGFIGGILAILYFLAVAFYRFKIKPQIVKTKHSNIFEERASTVTVID